jgi:hypothetical protein
MDESTSSQASSKLENFYTPLEEVVAELQKRRADTGLLQQVHSHLQDAIPEAFFSGPKAVLFRNIISPNTEFIRFLSQAEKLGYPPLGMEHTRDKFSTRNRDKMALAKLPLILGESEKF